MSELYSTVRSTVCLYVTCCAEYGTTFLPVERGPARPTTQYSNRVSSHVTTVEVVTILQVATSMEEPETFDGRNLWAHDHDGELVGGMRYGGFATIFMSPY